MRVNHCRREWWCLGERVRFFNYVRCDPSNRRINYKRTHLVAGCMSPWAAYSAR